MSEKERLTLRIYAGGTSYHAAKFKLRQSPYLANGQLCVCIKDQVHSKLGHGLINLAEMMFHAATHSISPPSVAHALLNI